MKEIVTRAFRDEFQRYVDGFGDAVGCISYAPVTAPHIDFHRPSRTYVIALSEMQPARCSGKRDLWLRAVVTFRVAREEGDASNPYVAREATYFYDVSLGPQSNDELLGYHWTGEKANVGAGPVTETPHLHLGAQLAQRGRVLPIADFQRLHIPTGHVSFPMVVRFLIEELGVEPINPKWESILADTGTA